MADARAARFQLLAAALLFSTGGAAVKACSLTALPVAGLRSLVAAVALVLLVPGARRLPSAGEIAVGVAYAGTLVFYVLGTKLATAAEAIFLQSTAPLYLLVLSPLVLRERITRAELGVLLAIAAGIVLFFLDDTGAQRTAPDPALGRIFGLASGLSWALTMLGLRHLAARPGRGDRSLGAVVSGNAICAVVTLPLGGLPGEVGLEDALVLLYLGVVQIALAYRFVTRAMVHLGAFEATLLLLVEPVFNPLWAFLVHGERPGLLTLAGGTVIFLATMAKTWLDARGAGLRASR